VIESADLPRLLRRIRRRARTLAALEGAVLGGALGAGMAAGAVTLSRALGREARLGAAIAGAVGAALIGAAFHGARRISLSRCARLADAALDRGGTPRDRVLSALAFLDGADTPLARAAVADAVSRARGLAPSLAAPARRPRQLPGLALAALALVVAGVWPGTAPGSRALAPGLPAPAAMKEPGLRIGAHTLDAERAEARAATKAAEAEGDVRLGKLAAELHATLEALTNGQLAAGEALERLEDVARRAREAGEDAAEAREALRAAGKALEATSDTRALGRALTDVAPDETARALEALAARADDAKASENVARALDAAAAALAGMGVSGEESGEASGGERQRRLARDAQPGAATGGGERGARREPSERKLERLRRDLEDTASTCRSNPEACGQKLRERAEALKQLQQEARGGEGRQRLESAARQARERLRRGDLERKPGGDERRFQRAARGQAPEGSGGERAAGRPGEGEGEGEGQNGAQVIVQADDGMFADDSGGSGEGMSEPEGRDGAGRPGGGGGEESGMAAQGQGAGHEPGADPLGGASATSPTRGREREARVRNGAGPNRSEVIESAARRGFATRDYVRVFTDYQPVVEESLSAAAVPEGRRYVVRRYFQLIRPRTQGKGATP
jgi:hypothetical protein